MVHYSLITIKRQQTSILIFLKECNLLIFSEVVNIFLFQIKMLQICNFVIFILFYLILNRNNSCNKTATKQFCCARNDNSQINYNL